MEEVYAWGSGSYGRLGLGHRSDASLPQRVSGVLNGCDIRSSSCGWYHSAVVTSTGEVATFGSKITKCLGTAACESDGSDSEAVHANDDNSSEGSGASHEGDSSLSEAFGGGACVDLPGGLRQRHPAAGQRGNPTSQPSNASGSTRMQQRAGGSMEPSGREAGYVPRIIRSFPSRVDIVEVAVGGDMLGAHTLAISRTGRLYSWGYGPACGLGSTRNVATPTLVTKFVGFSASELSSSRPQDIEATGLGRHLHGRYRHRPIAHKRMGLQVLRPRIIKAVCGGGFSAVLTSDGDVFTFGLSAGGRLGFYSKYKAQLRPRRLDTLREGTTDLAAGAGFVLVCSAAGRLISWGDNAKGQLGVGHLQESNEPLWLGRACQGGIFQAVAAGDSHSLALDSAGRMYSWGGEGGPMTGQGQPMPGAVQVDAAFQLRLRHLPHWWVRPCEVRSLLGLHVVRIAAGCLHSMALTREGALYAWGALLQAGMMGEGANRMPEVAWLPRLLAPSPKFPLARVSTMSAGGWHSLATAVPSCAIDRLVSRDAAESEEADSGFCDGLLVSRVDSTSGFACQVPLCCAALRARLAKVGGTDAPIWKGLSAQIVRRQPSAWRGYFVPLEPFAKQQPARASEPTVYHMASPDSEDDEDGESLMDIIAMRREQTAAPAASRRERRTPSGPALAAASSAEVQSFADEAAGKALPRVAPATSGKNRAHQSPGLQQGGDTGRRGEARPRVMPDFSSDSNSSKGTRGDEFNGKVVPQVLRRRPDEFAGEALPTPEAATTDKHPTLPLSDPNRIEGTGPRSRGGAKPRVIPDFSSDSSSFDDKGGANAEGKFDARRLPDEAAGKALQTAKVLTAASKTPTQRWGGPSQVGGTGLTGRGWAKPRVVPNFSSDSSSFDDKGGGNTEDKLSLKAKRPPMQLRARPGPAQPPLPIPIFSSSSSGSDRTTTTAATSSAAPTRPTRRLLPIVTGVGAGRKRREATGGTASSGRGAPARTDQLSVDLSSFGEAVLLALARFLHTDSLCVSGVIDETHPLWLRELQLRRLANGDLVHRGGDADRADRGDGAAAAQDGPTSLRAARGLLLRREVDELRRLGIALGLERLKCLCDQMLHRIDAPGAPALFVPASTLCQAMWTLWGHALVGPSFDGPDARVLCGPPGPRRRRWSHRSVPRNGELWAHAFVLCAGCEGLLRSEAQCCLKHCPHIGPLSSTVGSDKVRFELDLRDVQADVVFAWLRYLYTHQDLALLWPCSGKTAEENAAGESFWMELVRLAQRVGDWRLQLYAQDTLVGALTADNWASFAAFAEHANCKLLSETALMAGVRGLLPATLRSFKVPTGLEEQSESVGSQDSPDLTPITATIGAAASLAGRTGAAACGRVELEIEQRLLALRQQGKRPAALLDLKRRSPTQFNEFKYRLAEGVKSSQQVAEQLQRNKKSFDAQVSECSRDEKRSSRLISWEVAALGIFISCLPLWQLGALDGIYSALFWLAEARECLAPFTGGLPRALIFNTSVALAFLMILWQGLKG